MNVEEGKKYTVDFATVSHSPSLSLLSYDTSTTPVPKDRSFIGVIHTILHQNETHVQTRYVTPFGDVRIAILVKREYIFSPADQFEDTEVKDSKTQSGIPNAKG